ncbi:phospholipase D/nuclease [Rhizophagus irregularis]|uniref:phospholipase D n=1 Tax=Rhizophagus irregularis TaxID=588596 RepID=A0A2N0S4Y9_9GLOM|nr:phospholipase D/nuclease [Rhizophagus irregularis]
MKGDNRTLSEFLESIEKVKRSSPWVRQHRFDSYAPIRENAKVKWYVDGKNYFFAVSQAIMAAKLEIYIEDWWLSPELYLRRPPSKNEKYRLDNLLKKKAEEGVMIYIIVYKEVKLALTLDSWHTKTCLQHLHPNIRVQRHPDHGPDGTVFWAHHEKMLIIDCKIAFIGGLDLCFGRYDTHQHELVDFDPHSDNPSIWPGQDYSNPRVKDFNNVSDYNAEIVDKSRVPRMPWHDVSIGVVGHPARDIARHFIQRWNFIKEEKAFERESIPFLMPKGEYVSTRDESKFFGTCNIQLLRSSASWSSGIELENSIYNAYCHLIRSSEHFIYIENQFFITASEKDPDHEIKNRIGEFIVERIKKAHENNEKFRIIVVMPLLPAFEADLHSKDAGTIRMIMHWQYLSISRGGKSILEKISEAGINPENYISFFALRGHGKIRHSENRDKKTSNSTDGNDGSQNVNNVINGSKDSINNSGKTSSIENNKSQEVRQSHPSETTVDSFSDERPQYISNVNERIGGEPVLPDSIKQMDPKHIFVTEEIYIHSKLMIVDDRFVICGSANLNDRSQLGNRDSEIAIIVEDKETIDTFMNGKKYKASKFAYTLRSNLFKEHLGLLETQDHSTMTESSTSLLDAQTNEIKKCSTEELVFMDPLSDEFYNYWSQIAQNNTETYRSLFRCVPDDNVADWEQYKEFVPDPTKMFIGHVANPNASVEEIKRKLSNIRGHLVQFPTQFLKNEHLMGGMISNAVEIFT